MKKTLPSHGQMSEAFLTAAFLSASGGLQDAYTYLARGSVFANAQTGNIALLSESLFAKNWHTALRYLVPLLSFALGVAAAEMIRHFCRKMTAGWADRQRQCVRRTSQFHRFFEGRLHWRQLVLMLEILLLFFVGFLPESLNLPANALVSFSCAMQVQAFRKVNGYSFASTMCIGNIRSGVESLCACRITHNRQDFSKALHYFGIIFFFALGAGVGSRLILFLGLRAIWVSCLLLLAGFILMLIP